MERKTVNLLFLYGPTGSGKTRLLQLIAEKLYGIEPVIRVGSEQIVVEMYQTILEQTFSEFFDRYVWVENLLVDNLWILRSRPAAAKEMGRLIKARTANGNLTVLASDLSYQEVLRTLPAIGDYLKEERAVRLSIGTPPCFFEVMSSKVDAVSAELAVHMAARDAHQKFIG